MGDLLYRPNRTTVWTLFFFSVQMNSTQPFGGFKKLYEKEMFSYIFLRNWFLPRHLIENVRLWKLLKIQLFSLFTVDLKHLKKIYLFIILVAVIKAASVSLQCSLMGWLMGQLGNHGARLIQKLSGFVPCHVIKYRGDKFLVIYYCCFHLMSRECQAEIWADFH